MPFGISKQFTFSASHRLDGLGPDHKCGRLHGHNYVVELTLSVGTDALSEVGFVRDYGDLKDFSRWLDAELDHRHLNDIVSFNPTAENLCRWLFERWASRYPELSAVRVSETVKTWAEYRP
ncbi:6-carboxytetrahydropterin synthase QueD [Nocardiopsis sp. CT-R113]|uniref:6-carboxy-5,6,7,8-tetrahydropterin synthase n=1 Tax=Nocardiopsis codii TaxID=3065942 RepID=A0ABU7K5I5_9ACTN|nr:6-carboxytetrahydropterin synthase QueD [Nocardiopsis sp. CT-R113]MEE2037109.1 6-carboxytetrahydropterin synthase QueD [Nocardiopsis sp. CT-R113]